MKYNDRCQCPVALDLARRAVVAYDRRIRMRDYVASLIRSIEPLDSLEEAHRQAALEWIASGAAIFRTRAPDVPPQHLVCYLPLIDSTANKILLGEHCKAGLWLPNGGHVETDEDPRDTAIRELREELSREAEFIRERPVFITVTQTVGPSAHTDVSLWYLLRGDSEAAVEFDHREFKKMRWFDFAQIPHERSDPHIARFITKALLTDPR
jgi:8-oxo-dGTP diphosphatase